MNIGDTVMLDYSTEINPDGSTGYTAVIIELDIIPEQDTRVDFIHPKDIGKPGALVNWNWNYPGSGEPITDTDLSWVPISYIRKV